jgi:uracil-DNA glycosylase
MPVASDAVCDVQSSEAAGSQDGTACAAGLSSVCPPAVTTALVSLAVAAAAAPPRKRKEKEKEKDETAAPSALVPAVPAHTGGLTDRQLGLIARIERFDEPLRTTTWWEHLSSHDLTTTKAALVREVKATHAIEPKPEHFLRALLLTPLNGINVVVMAQDPFPTPGDACGLAFSCENGRTPPSLLNIFKEIAADYPAKAKATNGRKRPDPNLQRWAKQGVLLLNSALSVRPGHAGSHQSFGWTALTDLVIRVIDSHSTHPVVFLLWGAWAKSKASLINEFKTRSTGSRIKHHILGAAHPSPLSYTKGFKGCGHFRETNDLLRADGLQEIDW